MTEEAGTGARRANGGSRRGGRPQTFGPPVSGTGPRTASDPREARDALAATARERRGHAGEGGARRAGGMQITLRAGERIYVNGAVIRADRKVGLEFLNDVDFLLEQHVMQVEEATTPTRQLYFAAQAILLDPPSRRESKAVFFHLADNLLQVASNDGLRGRVKEAVAAVVADRPFEALRILRRAFPEEDAAIGG